MARLRAPGGCPWDAAQTRESLLKNLLEETYEVISAVEGGDIEGMREELGDLLLQVIFHALIADEKDEFDLGDVARALCDKLVRRHPHVFGDV
ncbi:MAG TPA: nucleoside triphosphate pyrophosphohydrolase, partial [Bacteroidetes bacterium]|nr:nucleoside triphosphate pyrophosphohydrolase [Bacteroidota bacterium]